MYKGVKMNKKIFILVFLFIALISMSAVSAADLDDSNETVALSEIGEKQIAVSNDVNAIDDLNKDDSDSEAVLGNAVKSSAAGEKEILGVENSDSDVLGATGTKMTSVNVFIDRNGALDVSGGMRDSNDGVIDKGTISVCLNDRVYATLDPGGALGFSTKVILTPGSYNLVLRYHDDSGDYDDCEYVYENNPIVKEPPTWYVDGSKSSSGNGKSEANAFVTLDEALAAASDGDKIKIAAGTYYNDFLPGGEDDFIRYREGKNAKSDVLENIDIPTLIVFGDNDECVLTVPIQDVKDYLKNNLKDCNIQIIKGTDHEYTDRYKELGKIIEDNI